MLDLLREKMYDQVPGSDIEDSSSSSDDLLHGLRNHTPKSPSGARTLLQTVLFLSATAAAVGLGFWLGRDHPGNLNDICIRHTSKYCERLLFTPGTAMRY
jgi:hypothetical protein